VLLLLLLLLMMLHLRICILPLAVDDSQRLAIDGLHVLRPSGAVVNCGPRTSTSTVECSIAMHQRCTSYQI
jgi:hypothetical protein